MQFDHFDFDPETDRLGEGPLSEVYLATDTKLGRKVALKILRAHAEIDPAADQRFRREAKHASKLQHPNIATIYEYGEAENTAFIAMEFLEGQTLDKILKDRTLGFEECIRIASRVASALAQVHKEHLIHRDLKPGNIMVLNDGDVKLLDFGIARQSSESSITQHGTLVGTVLYMSPEQVRGDDLDSSSDIFSLGAVLYHMATGELPFPGKSFPEVCMAILDGKPRRPSEVRSGFPPDFEELVLRCLRSDPTERYQTAEEVHGVLEHLSKGMRSDVDPTRKVEGRLLLMPVGCAGDASSTCRNVAGSLRNDLADALNKTKGLEVTVAESDAPPAEGDFDFLLRTQLTLEMPSAKLDLVLEPIPGDAARRLFDKVEQADESEWTLQDELVRAATRTVRKRLAELAKLSQPAPAVVPRKTERALELAAQAHEVLGYGTSKHLMASMSSFRAAIDADPYCAIAFAGLAEALVRKYLCWEGDEAYLVEAREMAEKALSIESSCARAHTSLGLAYQVSGMLTDAAREYRNAIRHDNNEWYAHRLLGEVLAREGNVKSAASLLPRAVALRPSHIPSYDLLYGVLQRLDRYEESLEVADNGIAAARAQLKLRADDQQTRLHLALLLARLASFDEARKHVRYALELAPKDGYTALRAACAFAVIGDSEAALDQLTRARDRGFYIAVELRSNGDLDGLRGLPEFKELVG